MLGLQRRSALHSSCLRCHLRQIIVQLSRQRLPSRNQQRFLRASVPRHEPDEPSVPIEYVVHQNLRTNRSDEAGNYWRNLKLENRDVEKPSLGPRQSVATLPSSTLGKPAEVILVHDIEERDPVRRPVEESNHNNPSEFGSTITPLTIEEIEGGIDPKAQPPEQDEVNVSIDTLRPDELILDSQQFERIVNALQESYTIEQLTLYLAHSADASTAHEPVVKQDSTQSESRWRSGKTKLSRRHASLKTQESMSRPTNKRAVARRIIRESWNVSTTQEEQLVGEIEMLLEPWQVELLFDITPDGRPTYKDFIDSEILSRAASIEVHRPDATLRVTARRQDAEEIIQRLKHGLDSVVAGEIDLTIFHQMLGQPGWPNGILDLFEPLSVYSIMLDTGSVVEQTMLSSISIYSRTSSGLETARRNLLSLLIIPLHQRVRNSIAKTKSQGGHQLVEFKIFQKKLVATPIYDSDIHERHRHVDLYRVTRPFLRSSDDREEVTSATDDFKLSFSEDMITKFVDEIKHGRSLFRPPADERDSGFWTADQDFAKPPWCAQIAVLLHPFSVNDLTVRRKKSGRLIEPGLSISQSSVPGINRLLEYFRPDEPGGSKDVGVPQQSENSHKQRLIATLAPSPFGTDRMRTLSMLPRLRLEFRPTTASATGKAEMEIVGAQAQIFNDVLNILLPTQATDVIFSRVSAMHARREALQSDPAFSKIREYLEATDEDRDSKLTELSSLIFNLPTWILHANKHLKSDSPTSESTPRDTPVLYSWQSLEKVETFDFRPRQDEDALHGLGPELRAILSEWPEQFVLRVSQIEAGKFGGRRTEVHIIDLRRENKSYLDEGSDVTPTVHITMLVRLTVAVTSMLNRLSVPNVKSPKVKPDEAVAVPTVAFAEQ